MSTLRETSAPPLKTTLVALLMVAALIRFGFGSGAPVFLEGDSQSYLLPGWELAQGAGFSPELRRAPAYPFLIAASFELLGLRLDSIALAQHVLGLATVTLTFFLGRRLFGTWAGVVAGWFVALSAPQLIFERYLMTEALSGFTIALALLLAVESLVHSRHAPRARSPWLIVLAGLAIALASLTRPVAQVILPLYLAALLALLPRWRRALKAAACALLGYALLSVPWALRNLAVHETPTLAGGLGRSLIARTVKYDSLVDWKWLSETHQGRPELASRARILLYNKRAQIPSSRSVRPYQDALVRELGMSQAEAESTMRQIGLEAIGRRPVDYLLSSLLFTGQVLVGREESLASHWKQRAAKDWGEQWDDRLDALVSPVEPTPPFWPALLADRLQPARIAWLIYPLALLGIVVAARDANRRGALLLAATLLALVALSAFLDGPVPRYRYPLDPLLAVLFAGGLLQALAWLGAWRRRAAAGQPSEGVPREPLERGAELSRPLESR
jgi:4-amino-4-deoxy-L-arabinose transferase-like glycosyltransferase